MPTRLVQFADAARDFIAWCESSPGETSGDLRELQSLLLRLYSLALTLELPESRSGNHEVVRSSDEKRKAVYERCASLPFNYYSEIFDPLAVPPEEEDAVVGDLADDVTDIHSDLAAGLSLYIAGHPVEAEWEWRFSFESHWGRHASSALRVVHCWFERNWASRFTGAPPNDPSCGSEPPS